MTKYKFIVEEISRHIKTYEVDIDDDVEIYYDSEFNEFIVDGANIYEIIDEIKKTKPSLVKLNGVVILNEYCDEEVIFEGQNLTIMEKK